jgi:glycosyltransferase involved in cell wall biosynthesis
MRTVSVIIPTLNEEELLPILLSDLQKQTLQPLEIIIIDAFSNDKTTLIANDFPNTVVRQFGPGVGKQRKYGGDLAKGDVLVFLDADTRMNENFLNDCVSIMEKRNLHIACPFYIPLNSNIVVHGIFWYVNIIFLLLQKILPSGAGPCIFVTKETFIKSGGFDPEMKFDDIEFVRRVGKKKKFGIITKSIYVSDRRFRELGIMRMIFQYITMSMFFTFGLFKKANSLTYKFGIYKQNKE